MTEHQNKKEVLMKGIGMHLAVYLVLSLTLSLLGAPPVAVFMFFMVLLWGLLVLSYAFYHKK